MDDQLRMSTSLTSEPLSCSALRLFVSRIKRAGWLRVEDQYHVVGGEKATAIPYLSIVRKKNKKEVGRGEALCCFILNASTQSWESFLSRAPTPGEEIFHAALSTAGRLGGEGRGQGMELEVGEERGWTVISRGQSLHNKQAGSRRYNWWALRVKSKWQLSCESMLWGSWPAPSLTLGEWSGGERRKK